MAKVLIQVCTMAGALIDNGKWMVDFPASLQQDQTVSFSMPIKDAALIGYLGKVQQRSCIVDKEGNDYVVSVSCKVMRIRHMVNTTSHTAESMAYATPEDRLAEHVMLYMLIPSKCDPKFVRVVRGAAAAPPAA
jgi:hypothetical protein